LLNISQSLKGLLLVAMFVGRMEPNEKLYRRSYIDASCQDWFNLAKMFLLLKKSFLKLHGQMEPIFAGNIYVRSSIKFLRFVPFGQQINFIEDLT
jgi:hypothetical protein